MDVDYGLDREGVEAFAARWRTTADRAWAAYRDGDTPARQAALDAEDVADFFAQLSVDPDEVRVMVVALIHDWDGSFADLLETARALVEPTGDAGS